MESMRLTVGLLKPKTVVISFVALSARISTRIKPGGSSGLRARPGVGVARHAGAPVRRFLNPPNFATHA